MLGTEPMAVTPMATFTPAEAVTPVGTRKGGGMVMMIRNKKRRGRR